MEECYTAQNEIKTVLFVEDEDAHADIIRRVFEEECPELSFNHVTSILDAAKWLESHNEIHPLLVISDYNLPEEKRSEWTKGAATLENAGFPLVILNGVRSEKVDIRTLKSGTLDFAAQSNEQLRQLPTIANYVLGEWNLMMQRKHAENELKHFINDLDEANAQLDDFLDDISRDLEDSISWILEFCRIMLQKHADKMDDASLLELKKVSDATERTNKLLDKLFDYVVPIYFNSSLIGVYSTKLDMLNRNELADRIKTNLIC
jgi:CheY-like chemotaxis protein